MQRKSSNRKAHFIRFRLRNGGWSLCSSNTFPGSFLWQNPYPACTSSRIHRQLRTLHPSQVYPPSTPRCQSHSFTSPFRATPARKPRCSFAFAWITKAHKVSPQYHNGFPRFLSPEAARSGRECVSSHFCQLDYRVNHIRCCSSWICRPARASTSRPC